MLTAGDIACGAGFCGFIDEDGASLVGEGGHPGSGGSGSAPVSGGGAGGASGSGPLRPELPAGCIVVDGFEYCHGEVSAVPDGEDGAPDDSVPAVTIADIAHFRPAPPSHASEPDGWGVVGLPVNLVAAAPAQALTGTVLGLAAEVRFTPITHSWRYGDGDVAQTAHPGRSWASLEVAEFTSTPTSHVYAAPGRYRVELEVEYRAEFRVDGSGWRPIAGVLVLGAADRHIVIRDATTVLVDDTCRANAHGPGC